MGIGRETRQIIRFGPYEADLASGQLRKNGLKIRIQEMPFRILTLLVERPGEVVTREELQEKLWPDGTFVEFEHSLNTAVNKLRTALGDDADVPRFVETVPRRGYRFICVIEQPREVSETAPAEGRLRRHWLLAAVSGLLAVSLAMNILSWRREPAGGEGLVRRFTLPAPQEMLVVKVSPDGLRVAYVNGIQQRNLWVQDLDRTEPRLIAGPGFISQLIAWSPDGESIAYVYGDQLVRTFMQGGTVQLSPIKGPWAAGPSDWSIDGRILFNPGPLRRVFEVSAGGGEPQQLNLVKDEKETEYVWPAYLPGRQGGHRILAQRNRAGERGRVVALDLETGQREVLAEGERPIYSPTGHVLYEASGSLWVVAFSPQTLKSTGTPILVAREASMASISRLGDLVYLGSAGQSQHLIWRDRDGKDLGGIGQPQTRIMLPSLSPDGNRVVVLADEGLERDVWVHEVGRPSKTRVTTELGGEDRPAWHPDGKRISYSSPRAGSHDVYLQHADGSGKPETLIASDHAEHGFCWSSDAQYLVFDRVMPGGSDIWYLRHKPDGTTEQTPFVKSEFDELSPSLSADGRFLAFESNRSGRYEVYVRPFPNGGQEWQISTHGGHQPRWRRDGKELFYVGPDALMAVAISSGRAVDLPRKLFRDDPRGRGQRYDVAPDGQRFVMVKTIHQPAPVIRVVQNWLRGAGQATKE